MIDIPDRSLAGHFSIATDHSHDAIFAYVETGTTTIALDPGQKRNLLLVQPPDFDGLDKENRIVAEVFWRFVQPIVWQGNRRLCASIPKGDYETLQAGKTKKHA